MTSSPLSTARAVHPHVRGVYWKPSLIVKVDAGPSPRAWGLRLPPFCPAPGRSVHPHVRGVYSAQPGRGAGPVRSIPTCVGFTIRTAGTGTQDTVHPHVRGVYIGGRRSKYATFGPSPRAWGLLWIARQREGGPRSIPTCVGFTSADLVPAGPLPVHPHVRGVYNTVFTVREALSGPSPRAWGLHVVSTLIKNLDTVHPHVRGVYHPGRAELIQVLGPSPRAWGLRSKVFPTASAASVHPHVRGVYFETCDNRRRHHRSIPTCVGFTEQRRKDQAEENGPSPRAWGLPLK